MILRSEPAKEMILYTWDRHPNKQTKVNFIMITINAMLLSTDHIAGIFKPLI